MLSHEARPPPEADFYDAFQKLKHAFNLLVRFSFPLSYLNCFTVYVWLKGGMERKASASDLSPFSTHPCVVQSRDFQRAAYIFLSQVDSKWKSFEVQCNPLSPNIYTQILQTDLHTFPLRISWENLIRSKHFLFSDHFINSHNLISWQGMNIVGWKLMLVTIGT